VNDTGHDPGGVNAAILLTEEERCDPDVLAFMAASVRAKREEKSSDPAEWTAQESAAYSRGDWRTFSRLRGYTEAEIANFGEFIRLAGVLDARYGRDYAASLSFAIDEARAQPLASPS
jgi:hypothetical protein